MATLSTQTGAAILRPEQINALVVQPAMDQSVAANVSTVVRTGSTEYRIPVVTDDPAARWTRESEEITATDLALEEITVRPPKLAGLSIISRELAEDSSPAATEAVGQGLARDIARQLDAAYFGDLADPAPTGLAGLDGTVTVTAPFTNLDGLAAAMSGIENVGAVTTAFVASPDVALTLTSLKDAESSNRPLLGADPTAPTGRSVFGVPLFVSPAVAEGTTWAIARDRSIVVLREDTRLEVDYSAYFSRDDVAVKATMRVGFGYPHEAALVKVTAPAGE